MRKLNRFTLIKHVLAFLLAVGITLVCGTAMGQDDEGSQEEFTLEEITVTAQFTETNLQETPISITAVTGKMLEERNIQNVQDLGLIIPNAAFRQESNNWGPNAQIGIRGVDTIDFIPAFEPGVVVYVDDLLNETVVGSTLQLVDLERVEVLRGPQGTLFGKNAIGGAIRLISKTPQGDNTGHFQVTYGDYHRLDFSGSYDFSLIEDRLFARISATSKRVDGYMDRLDWRCQMEANGTPELAGDFPSYMRHWDMTQGNCKVGEKGGSNLEAAKLMLRYLPADRLEINVGIDYTDILADTNAETMVRGRDPEQDQGSLGVAFVEDWYQTNYGVSILGDHYVPDSPYVSYETFADPIYDIRWPDKVTEDYTNFFAKVDYDITEDIHLKGILGYREYQQVFPSMMGQPFSFRAYIVDQKHDITSYEVRLNGRAFDERLDWTVGGYLFESYTHHSGAVTLGTDGIWMDLTGLTAITGWPFTFDVNDVFENESISVFAHGIFAITDNLSLTAGGRMTDEDKTFAFDHKPFFYIEEPLSYGRKHYDWKLALDYQFTDAFMAYVSVATGFRSEGANPRPFTRAQLLPTPDEEVISYEIGARTDWFGNRLRINPTAFYLDYDPRVSFAFAAQCTDPLGDDPGEPYYDFVCPPGTWVYENNLSPQWWPTYFSAPGTAKGVELDITARPINNLDINASVGYYDYETDVGPDDLGYLNPDHKMQAEWNYSAGAQYRINFKNGAMLIPRIDMFYQGERTNGDLEREPIPGNVTPDYTLFNGRLTYMSPDTHWSISLEAQNLFNKFYWINYPALKTYDDVTDEIVDAYGLFGSTAQPGVPRQVSVTLRYNFF